LSAHDTQGGERGMGPGRGAGEPTEDELRAAYEAELSRLTTTDMMAQAAVSLLNIGAHRLAPPSAPAPGEAGATGAGQGAGGSADGAQPDLEQARDAIDGVKALLDILERRIPRELGPLRDALSRLQMAYAREMPAGVAGATAGAPGQPPGGAEAPPAPGESQPAQEGQRPDGPGPAESSGRLWVPGR
jgi:hypothetical protein